MINLSLILKKFCKKIPTADRCPFEYYLCSTATLAVERRANRNRKTHMTNLITNLATNQYACYFIVSADSIYFWKEIPNLADEKLKFELHQI